MRFNWEFYINKYNDLNNGNFKSHEDAWYHWLTFGKKERRMYTDISIFFNWINYIENNPDLIYISCEEDAWRHFLYHGRIENRYIYHYKILKQYCL